jgi:hypothetical protein
MQTVHAWWAWEGNTLHLAMHHDSSLSFSLSLSLAPALALPDVVRGEPDITIATAAGTATALCLLCDAARPLSCSSMRRHPIFCPMAAAGKCEAQYGDHHFFQLPE